MLFSELVDCFNSYNRLNRAPRTAEFYEGQLKRIVKLHGGVEAAEIAPIHLSGFRETWHLVYAVQRLFSWAVKVKKLLSTNPFADVQRPKLGKRKRTLVARELILLLRGAARDFREILLAARECAARPQELRALRWEELCLPDFIKDKEEAMQSGLAYFEQHEYKGQARRSDPTEPRIIPISPRLGRLLWRKCRGRYRSGLVFVTHQGKAWDRNSLRLRMHRLRKRVAIPETVHGEKVVCYTLRHSTATHLAGDEMQTSVLQQLLGHADVKTTQRYIHLGKAALMKSWQRYHDGKKRP